MNWNKIKYFSSYEFDSPDVQGSGKKIKKELVQRLDQARELAGVAFHINSGVRTAEHNRKVGGVANSSHIGGWAADIKTSSSINRLKILTALIDVEFRRIGIHENFIHVDIDPDKTPSIWLYNSGIKALFTKQEI